MAITAFCGLETGDGSELSAALQTTYTVQSSIKRTGSYALKTDCASYAEQPIFSGLAATTLYLSFKHYFEDVSTPGSDKFGAVIVLRTAGGVAIASIQQFHTSSGGYALTVRNEVSGTNHGTNYFVSAGQWYTLQLNTVISATVGVVELKIDSLTTLTLSAQNTGTTAINDVRAANVSSSPSSGFHNQYFDDWAVATSGYPGDQRVIARQGKSGAPTYNAWTKSSGTDAYALWSDTPFSAATECHSTAQNQAQTMLLADVGAGTDAIGASDTINGCRVVGIGKLRAGTNKRTYSVRRRIGGVDTDESVTAQQSTAGDAIFQGSIFTTTRANLQSGEIGGLRGATTSNSQEWQIEDMWMMVAYTPVAAGQGPLLGGQRNHLVRAA
jgi:hypothetical protein